MTFWQLRAELADLEQKLGPAAAAVDELVERLQAQLNEPGSSGKI